MSDKFEDEVQAAFPDRYRDGMTLRDYMAAQAMQGMLAAKGWHPNFMFPADFNFDAGQRAADSVAAASYQYADAMLKAREQ